MNHKEVTKPKNMDCKVCAFLAKADTTSKEVMVELGTGHIPVSGRCEDHPANCIHCNGTVFYIPDDIHRALGKNGGTPLPRRCEPCRDKIRGRASNKNEEDEQHNKPVQCSDCRETFRYSASEIIGAKGKNGGTPLPKRCESCRASGKTKKSKFGRTVTEESNELKSEVTEPAAADNEQVDDSFSQPVKCLHCKEMFHYTEAEIHRASGKNGGTPLPKRCETCRAQGRRWRERLDRSFSEDGESVNDDNNGSPEKPIKCVYCREPFHYTAEEIHAANGKHGGTPLPKKCERCRFSGRKNRRRRLSSDDVEENEEVAEEEEQGQESGSEQSEQDDNGEYNDDDDAMNQPVQCNLCGKSFHYTHNQIKRARGKNGGTPLPKKCETCRPPPKKWRNKKNRDAADDNDNEEEEEEESVASAQQQQRDSGASSKQNTPKRKQKQDINFASDEVVESLSKAFDKKMGVSSNSAANTTAAATASSASAPSSRLENLLTNSGGKAILSKLTQPVAAGGSASSGRVGQPRQGNGTVEGPFSSVTRNEKVVPVAAPAPAPTVSVPPPPTLVAAERASPPAPPAVSAAPVKVPPPLVPAVIVRPMAPMPPAIPTTGGQSPFNNTAAAYAAGGSEKSVKAAAPAPAAPAASKTSIQAARDLEYRERRHKGTPITNPTSRKDTLPIYCGGGKLCGAEILYRLDHAPAHCPGTPSHVCNWSAVRCVYCRFTWEKDHVTVNENGTVRLSEEVHEMFTHHYCLHCHAGVHGGISNQYGILLH